MTIDAARSVTKNAAVMMGSQVVTWISTFILMLFLPRYLGSEEYGRLYLAISVGMIIQIIIEFGGNYYIPKEVSRDRESAPSLVMNFILVRILLWVVSILLLAGFANFASYPREVKGLLFIIGTAKLWEGIAGVVRNCLQGFEKMEYTSAAAIVERTFLTAVGVVALCLGAGTAVIAAIMAVSTLLNFLTVAKFFRRFVPRLPRFDPAAALRIMRSCLPYFLYSVFAVVYYRVDAVMLSLMAPEPEVGWYGAAYRFFDVLMFLPSIITTALFPVLSRLWIQDEAVLGRTSNRCLDFVILAAIPVGVCTFAYAEQIIQFFFGIKEYGPSVIILRIFSFGILMLYIDMILGTMLFASDRQRQWTVVAFIALVLNPLLNYVLIPIAESRTGNGGIGAALATLLTEVVVMIAALRIMPAHLLGTSWIYSTARGAGAGVLMVIAIVLGNRASLPWVPAGIIAMGLYIAALLAMRAFRPAELAFFQVFFSSRNLKTIFPTQREMSA